MKTFDYSLNYAELDLRKHPELYTVGRGEQGVLMVEPYKSEILSYWRFKTPEIATESSEKIYELFLEYKKRMISLAWIWHASFYRWGTREPDVIRITKVGANIRKRMGRSCRIRMIRSRRKRQPFSRRSGRLSRLTPIMLK